MRDFRYYVYRYIDRNDMQIKYVGITNDIHGRDGQHRNGDDWYSYGDWLLEYFEVPNEQIAYNWETCMYCYWIR